MSKTSPSYLLDFAPDGHLPLPGHLRVSRTWGSLDFRRAPGVQAGWHSYRLAVIPPGTNHGERRRLSVLRVWVTPGAYIAPFVLALASAASLPLAGGALIVYLGVLVYALRSTRRLRTGTRMLALNAVPGGWAASTDAVEKFRRSVIALRALDEASECGQLNPVLYELKWAAVYTALR